MIISASRRTDIPAFYSEWFYNRIKEGFVYVRNPMFYHQVSRVALTPDVIDGIVFWTKNAQPMLPRLNEISSFNYYFQFTINPYNQKLEKVVPRKTGVIDGFRKLSDQIGPERVIWRYDPIFFTDDIDLEYHLESFDSIAQRLSTYTNVCMLGFLHMYKKTERNMAGTTARPLNKDELLDISGKLKQIANSYNIAVESCSERVDLVALGIKQGKCIDNELIEKIAGYSISTHIDRNQRPVCRCIESIDIGEYDTCPHDCLYCYANSNKQAVVEKYKIHNPNSPLIIGQLTEKDIIKERKIVSLRRNDLFT